MKHNFTFSKSVCDFITYLYTLREATRWEGNLFIDENCEIASKVYDCVTTGNYEPEQSDTDTDILPSESMVLRFVNPKFIEAYPSDIKIAPFLTDGKIKKSPVEIFIGWLKKMKVKHPKGEVFYLAESFYRSSVENYREIYKQPSLETDYRDDVLKMVACAPSVGVLMTTVQSHLIQALKDNPIMRNAYSTMLDVIAVTKPTDHPEFKTHQPPKGVLFTAMLIDEYNRECHSPGVGNIGLRDMIDDIIHIAAEGRSDVHKYAADDANVAGCIRWLLFSGVDITKLGIVNMLPDTAYDSPTAGYLAYMLGYSKILVRVIDAIVAADVGVCPDTVPAMYLSWRTQTPGSTRCEGLMALMKLKQRMTTPDYVKYCLCHKQKKLVID